MSELRIRSEAAEIWPERFDPPPVTEAAADVDYSAVLAAIAQALTALFGAPVRVAPARDASGDCVVLAGLLATLRLGGDPARPMPVGAGGATIARHRAQIMAAASAAALPLWPVESQDNELVIEVACHGCSGVLVLAAPGYATPPPPEQSADLAQRLLTVPMRLRVELAGEMAAVSALLPLRAGTVLPIAPQREMALLLGDHRIGRAMLTPLPDGRQQAEIIDIAVQPAGGFA